VTPDAVGAGIVVVVLLVSALVTGLLARIWWH